MEKQKQEEMKKSILERAYSDSSNLDKLYTDIIIYNDRDVAEEACVALTEVSKWLLDRERENFNYVDENKLICPYHFAIAKRVSYLTKDPLVYKDFVNSVYSKIVEKYNAMRYYNDERDSTPDLDPEQRKKILEQIVSERKEFKRLPASIERARSFERIAELSNKYNLPDSFEEFIIRSKQEQIRWEKETNLEDYVI